jgi:heme exporter protein A
VTAVEVTALSHTFGEARVLRDVDLRVEAGERVAVFGPNGAGKSTLLRVLATLIRPTAGSVRILGLDPRRELLAVRRRIGVVGHRTYLDDQLTAAENLRYYGRLYDVAGLEGRIGELLELVGLRRRADDRVRVFSRGMQQRLALARALLHDPDLLLLDEPDTGLDAQGVELLGRAVERAGRAVVMTSHHPERAMRVAARALLLVDGRVALDGPIAEVVAVAAPGAPSPPDPLSRPRERGNRFARSKPLALPDEAPAAPRA